MKFYIHSIRNGKDFYSSYQGMSQEVIINLLTELECTNIQFITEVEYNLVITSQKFNIYKR